MKTKRTCKSIFMLAALFAVLSAFTSVKADAAALVPKEVNVITDEEAPAPVTTLTLPAGDVGITKAVVPVKVNHAGVLAILAVGTNGTEASLYSDAACTRKVNTRTTADLTFFGDNSITSREIIIPRAGTYYLALSYWLNSAASAGNGRANVMAYAYNGEDKTLSSGKWSVTYTDDYNKTVYHKIVMKSAGYIDLTGNGFNSNGTASSLSATITNSKKKVISNAIYLYSSNNYSTRVAVGKGTYYVAVKKGDIYQLCYKSKAIKEKSGKNKKKAVTLKKKKTVNALMLMGESTKKADWYKVKLKKKSKLKFQVRNYGDDTISVQVVPANKRFKIIFNTSSISGNTGKTITSTKKWPKGTYYLKFTKRVKAYSSHYTVKLK